MKPHMLSFSTCFTLSGCPPYSFELSVHKPANWPLLTPYEIFEGNVLWTVMSVHGRLFGLKLSSTGMIGKPAINCVSYSDSMLNANEKRDLKKTLLWMLGLEQDLRGFYSLAKRDQLVEIIARDLCGMRSTDDPNLFSGLILAVTLQMAPISRSNQMMELLIKKYGESVRFDGREVLYWPRPETIAAIDVDKLQKECRLGYRAKILRGIAEALISGFPSAQALACVSPDEAKQKLMRLKGIGEYSAEIVSPHGGFPLDVWSARIFSFLLHRKVAESPRGEIPDLRKDAETRWGRWRSQVFVYVLNDLDKLSRRFKVNLKNL